MKSIAALVKTLNDPISRNDLVNMVIESGIEKSPGKVIRHLMDNYKKYITKKNPVVFNFASLAKVADVANPVVAYEVPHKSLTLEEEAFEMLRGLDATKDPELNKFIRTDSYKELEELLEDGEPINIFISGESGTGKSSSVMMAAKKFNRPVVRVNFSHQTDFDDMMCSIRLKDDSTYVELGPVVIAALTGSILLLDELDFGNPKLLSDLHPVLEGRGFMVKRLNKMIFPKEGFMVIATANTRGRGEGSEHYVGTNVLNKAFLERFAAFIEFGNPTKSELTRIIGSTIDGVPDPVVKGIVEWYDKINDAIKNGVLIEHVGIRRVIDICKLSKKYKVQTTNDKNMVRALEKGCNIYPSDMSEALISLWDSMYIMDKVQNDPAA